MRIFTLCFLLTLFSTSLFSQQGKLYIDILDNETNLPIKNCQVTIYKSLNDSVVINSSNGTADSRLNYGKYSVKVEKEGYVFDILNVVIESDVQFYKIISKRSIEIPEIQITSLGVPKRLSGIITPVSVLKNSEIMQQSSLTAADALAQIPGVYVARDGAWASSVNLRGLSDQRIVTMIDGFRVETASELAGGFGLVDLNNIARIEVVKGSVSDLQGTGAVGGLINYVSHDAYYNDKMYTGGEFSHQYQSANGLNGTHLTLNTGAQKWWFTASATLRHANDLRTPDGKLPNSSFNDGAINLKAAFKVSDFQELKLIYQKFKAEDVGLTGGNFPTSAKASYKNASRDLAGLCYSIKSSDPYSIWRQVNISGFYQFIERDVEVIVSPTVKLEPVGKHTTFGLKANSEWLLAENWNVEAGVEMWQREMTSFRKKTVVSTKEPITTTIFGELPLPHAWYTSTGSYVMSNYNPWSFLKLSLSARADLIHIKNDQAITPQYQSVNGVVNNSPSSQRIIFSADEQNNQSFGFQGGASFILDQSNKINLMIAKSFRSPSLEERFKYIDLGISVNYGNPALEPENGWFYNAGYVHNSKFIDIKIDGFVNSIHNYITSVPGKFAYLTPSNTADTMYVDALVAANLNHAVLYGGELSTALRTSTPLSFSAGVSYVRGIEKNSDTNLPLMPPLNGQVSIHYNIENWCMLTAQVKLADKQSKVAAKETTTGGYALYNLFVQSSDFNLYYCRMKLFVGVENLTDRAWRNHLATNRGLVRLESGRNAFVKLQLNW
jgi:outer membrane cobalamin receptor